MNFKKGLILISWIYCIIYIIFDLPMDHWYWRAIRGVFSVIVSLSLLLFILSKIDNWKARTN